MTRTEIDAQLKELAIKENVPKIIHRYLEICKEDNVPIVFNSEKEREEFYQHLCNHKKNLEYQMKLCNRAIRNVAINPEIWDWRLDEEDEKL